MEQTPEETRKLVEIYEQRDEEQSKTTLSLKSFPMIAQKTKFGFTYPKCTANIETLLNHHPEYAGNFRFDTWTQKQEIRENGVWRDLDDDDAIKVQCRIQRLYPEFFATIGKEIVQDAITSACLAHSYDSAEQYIRSLTWDNKSRLKHFIFKAYGVPVDDYSVAVGENFWKSIARRITEPGCKVDTILVIIGEQGKKKSQSLSLIAGKKWYVETTMKADNKDFFMQFKGKLIIDFAEGETMNRSEMETLKAVASTPIDTYRPSYGRISKDFPRRCVFTMTTNQEEFLKDETGNRRYYPIHAENIDLDWIRENRDQLFAEALYRVETLNEPHWEYPASSEDIQRAHMIHSQYEDTISDWCAYPTGVNGERINLDEGLRIIDVWRFALLGDKSRFKKREEMEIASALRAIGFEKKQVMIDGMRLRRWFK